MMSSRKSSAIGTSSSAARILRLRCTSVERSSVSRFTSWLETLAGAATLATVVRAPYQRIHWLLCLCV